MFDVLILGRLQDDEDLAHNGYPFGPFLQGRDWERVRPSSVLHEHDRDGLGSGQGRRILGQLLLRHAPMDVPGHALEDQRKTSWRKFYLNNLKVDKNSTLIWWENYAFSKSQRNKITMVFGGCWLTESEAYYKFRCTVLSFLDTAISFSSQGFGSQLCYVLHPSQEWF